jgi:hypothetical protein
MIVFKNSLVLPGGLKTLLNRVWGWCACFVILTWLLAACASIQSPTGGPKDTEAPKVVQESPKNLSTKFKSEKIELEFDEFIKLNNAFTEISISPALENPLDVQAKKEKLEIKIGEALAPNTTYTINFGKGVGDVNENNLLKNYNYVFSTGETLDSLSVSGKVVDALTNEVMKEATVFLFPVEQDSLLGKKKPSIYTLTDTAGNFKLNNLRAQAYRIYALKETSADRIYNEAIDEIGFVDSAVQLNKNIDRIKLRVFKEEPSKVRVLDKKMEGDGAILLSLNKGVKGLKLKELNTNYLTNSKTEINLRGDSAKIWLANLDFDSLRVSINDQEKEIERVSIYRNKRETFNRTPVIRDNATNGKLRPDRGFEINLSMPVTASDLTKVSFKADSVELAGWSLVKVLDSERKYRLNYALKPGKKYNISYKEGAFTGISGNKTKAYSKMFTVEDLENFGNLTVLVSASDSSKQYVLQLLSESKTVLREEVVSGEKTIIYNTYPVGKYTLRFVLDENRNGKWDTGNLKDNRQPEKTWNYEKVITLRANWDLEEKITIQKDL